MPEEKRILLVDDNSQHQTLVQKLLAGFSGYSVVIATSFTRGIDSLESDEYDIYLVADIIAKRNGLDLLIKAAETAPNKPVIFLTDSASSDVWDLALKSGATDYLLWRTLTPELLDRAIRYSFTSKQSEAEKQSEASKQLVITYLKILAGANQIITSSLNLHETIPKLADYIVGELADWCIVSIVENGVLLTLARSHTIPPKSIFIKELEEINLLYPKNILSPLSIRKSDDIRLLSHLDETSLRRIAVNKKQLRFLAGLGTVSLLVAPLVIHDNLVGVLTLARGDSGKNYSQADIPFIRDFCQRIATAIENSRLYQESKQSEVMFKRMAESDMIGIVITDGVGNILGVNDVVLKIIGYAREEVNKTQLNWHNLVIKNQHSRVHPNGNLLNKKGLAAAHEQEILCKDGHKVPVLVGSMLLNKEMQTVLSFVVDITKQKELERQKDEFISIASHELKTPLTSQRLFVALMRKSIQNGNPDEMLRLLGRIEEQNNRLIRLVRDLLDISRIDAGKMLLNIGNIDLNTMLADLVNTFRESASRVIELETDISRSIPCDGARIEQVITNLLTNAIKYSPDTTKIIIKAHDNQDSVQVSVTDFGIGIAPENLGRIFNRFFRSRGTNTTYPGFGLGLYISNEIIRRHNGKITVISEEGKGSTFTFILPVSGG